VPASFNQPPEFDVPAELTKLLAARHGHFRFESGHHGNLWLDLEPMFLRPKQVRPFAERLADLATEFDVAAVCGPLSGGAFVAEMVAESLDREFYFTEPTPIPGGDTLFPVKYRLPQPMREMIVGKRIAIINDVINAGSAVRGTYEDLQECGAAVAVVATLAILGNSAIPYFTDRNVPMKWLVQLSNELWLPADCPLCRAGQPLDPSSVSVPGEANYGPE
jgi:orotate phosphoribosyltransferase